MNLLNFLLLVLLVSCMESYQQTPMQANSYHFTSENELRDSSFTQQMEDFYNQGIEGTFSGKATIPIYYKIFEQKQSDKVVLISTGRTEAAVKYKEVIYDFYQNGYAVYIFDHRGQGQSGRMTTVHDMGYVDSFQFYVDDMKTFYDSFIAPKNYSKKYLLAHSMGGAIAVSYLEQFETDFDAVSLSSPMLGFSPWICWLVKFFNSETPTYAIGQKDYDDDKTKFKGNNLTGSEIRYHRMVDAFAQVPEARLGGVSNQWISKSCKQFETIFRQIDEIQTPFVLFTAENEQIVNPKAHTEFVKVAKSMGKTGEAYLIANAKHEILMEKDEPRNELLSKTLDFFAIH